MILKLQIADFRLQISQCRLLIELQIV